MSSNCEKTEPDFIHERINGTPFTVIKKEEEIKIACGKYIVAEPKSWEEAIEMIKNKEWDLITSFVMIMFNEQKNIEEFLKNQEND